MKIFQPIALSLLCLIFLGCNKSTPAASQEQPSKEFNPQPTLNSINDTIQKAVGAGIDDQIPGFSYGHDQIDVETGGLECPTSFASVNAVSKVLAEKLTSQYGTNLNSPRIDVFPPQGDVMIHTTLEQDGVTIQIAISVFKRGSGRVQLSCVLVAE